MNSRQDYEKFKRMFKQIGEDLIELSITSKNGVEMQEKFFEFKDRQKAMEKAYEAAEAAPESAELADLFESAKVGCIKAADELKAVVDGAKVTDGHDPEVPAG